MMLYVNGLAQYHDKYTGEQKKGLWSCLGLLWNHAGSQVWNRIIEELWELLEVELTLV